jgi:hypothetical protein
MSGTQRTAEAVGELVYASREAALHCAKVLRARGGLWPAPGRGVRNAAFTETHLSNLLMALGLGEPVRAVETVTLFRALRRAGPPTVTRVRETNPLLLPPGAQSETTIETRQGSELPPVADSLGGMFDIMVLALADPNTPEGVRYIFRTSEMQVTINPSPGAQLTLRMDDKTYTWAYQPMPAQSELPIPALTNPKTAELQRTFYGYAFDRLAAIWNDTQTAASGRSSANETAASRPGEAAAARDQPAEADGCSAQTHPTSEREKPQSRRRAGHSHQSRGGGGSDVRPGPGQSAAIGITA